MGAETTSAAPGRTARRRRGVALIADGQAPLETGFPFAVLVVLTLFTFLNIPNRVEAIAVLRPTILLTAILAVCLVGNLEALKQRLNVPQCRWLLLLVAYIVLTLPFVKWPGSVITKNFEIFARSIVFFFFVLAFVDSVSRLRVFVAVFVFGQVFRCLEPLAMHLTTGYWGGATFFDGETMQRLSGAPADPVNGNGLAFVIVTAIPFLHYWATSRVKWWRLCIYITLMPALIYALLLTASRSGLVALGCVVLGFVWLSRRRIAWIAAISVCVVLAVPMLSAGLRDRYVSLVDHTSRQGATVTGRVTGLGTNFDVFLHRPIFGFGLGTSLEADFNVAGETHYAHNLYLETLIELGVGGFIILVGYLMSVLRSAKRVLGQVRFAVAGGAAPVADILVWLPKALLVWIAMCLLFSLASYGLSEYQWYLIGGLAAVTERLASKAAADAGVATATRSGTQPVRGVRGRVAAPASPR